MKDSSVINKPAEPDSPEPGDQIPAGIAPFILQPDTEPKNANSYHLSELLKYHDRTFVLNAFTAIAKQPPEPGELELTLNALRSGSRSKTEIIEDLVATHPNVRVDGLSSPAIRSLSRWPVIGYVIRVLRAIARLPVLVKHQQQFECYVAGQQQRMADHVNDVLLAPGATGSELSTQHAELAENVSDVIKTVMMLSDSLIELLARFAEGEDRLQTLQAQREKSEAYFHADLKALTEQLSASAQQQQKQQEQAATSVQHLQKQQEQSEARLHADLVALTNQLSAEQQNLSELRRAHDSTVAAQREFLVDEQRVIVEAQRAALTDLQEQLEQSTRQHAAKVAQLAAELHELRAAVEEFQQTALRK